MGIRTLLGAAIPIVLVAACAATSEQVADTLGSKFRGQNIDRVVMQFGPPINSFKMSSGATTYEWRLGDQTNIATSKYGGTASTHYCKLRAMAGPDGVITDVSTEDASNMLGESLCAMRLGMFRQ
jgi:hypothetical protein